MTFTRSESGIKNYKKFYNVEAIFYIEGRMEPSNSKKFSEDEYVYDTFFYTVLLKLLSPYESVKIKIVGNKKNVLDYHDKIINDSIPYSFAVIDRDYDDVLFTRLKSDKLITTYGYSWENDFWSGELCHKVLRMITLNFEHAASMFKKLLIRSVKRVALLSRANIISKYYGAEIFPINKKGGSKGFKFDVNLNFPVCLDECKRLLNKVSPDIEKSKELDYLINITNLEYSRLIQGHYFEYLVINIINYCYKKSTNKSNKVVEVGMIKNLAFNEFKLKPEFFLEPQVLEHYAQQLSDI